MVLQSDPERLLTVLEYVRYRLSTEVQAKAVAIMSLLAARMPGLPDLMLQADDQGRACSDGAWFASASMAWGMLLNNVSAASGNARARSSPS